MNLDKRIVFILIILISLMFLSASSANYKGTGFTHNIPDNYYDSYSAQEILSKYNNTYLTSEKKGVCTTVVDGDTIYLSSGEKIRFVGVNTPEKGVTGYHASKKFVKKLCLNKEVGINVDDRKYTDKYGRTLAVVIVDGKNLNEMLLKEGLAEVMYIPPSEFSPYKWASTTTQNSNHVATTSTDSNAKSVSTSDKTVSGTSSSGYIGNAKSHKLHVPGCEAVDKMSEKNKVFFSSKQEAYNQGYVGCKMCNP
ncbi:MAG: hypothetical protein BZ135_00855 [Methanosphaera sp. rholeuAM6]|nr:MAG: hypothetical protein BZ135_00855 [Methanosphaera sp. rholeuAM6]